MSLQNGIQNKAFQGIGTQTATQANLSAKPYYYRLTIETAPQGGFYVFSPANGVGEMHIILAAFSTMSEALNFIDNSLRRV